MGELLAKLDDGLTIHFLQEGHPMVKGKDTSKVPPGSKRCPSCSKIVKGIRTTKCHHCNHEFPAKASTSTSTPPKTQGKNIDFSKASAIFAEIAEYTKGDLAKTKKELQDIKILADKCGGLDRLLAALDDLEAIKGKIG